MKEGTAHPGIGAFKTVIIKEGKEEPADTRDHRDKG